MYTRLFKYLTLFNSRADLCDPSMSYLFMVEISGEFTYFVVLKRSPLKKGAGEKPCIYFLSALMYRFLILRLTVQGTSG